MSAPRILTIAVAAIALSIGTAGPAAAEDLRVVAGPKKVVVNQAYENVSWRVAGSATGYLEDVDATLEHVSTREQSDWDYASSAPWAGSFKFYNWERMGRYVIRSEAYDVDYNEMSVAPAYVVIKRAAAMRFSATRAKGRVTLRAVVRKYNGSYPTWAAHRGAKVRFQRYLNGSWRTFATRTVARNAVSTLSFRAPARSYRAVVLETGTVWGKTSGVRRR